MSQDIARYKFKRDLERIRDARGRGTELISLYVPPDRQISDAMSYLRNEYSQSSNIKSKGTRKNVMAAIESIMSRLKVYKRPPENGVVFFIGHKSVSADQTQMVQFVLEPPEPTPTFLYRCDSEFFVEPLLQMLEEKDTYGLIVIDRSEATVGFLRGRRVELVKNIQSLVPSKHSKGGQSARRFERLIEIAAHEFFTKVGNLANEAFLSEEGLDGILVGGPGATKDFFASKDYLHHELRKKLINTFDTGYTDEYGLRELVEKAQNALSDLDLMREKRLIDRLLREIKKPDAGLAVYGEDHVREALKLGAVDTLLLSEGIERKRLDYICGSCGAKESLSVDSVPPNKKCGSCGEGMVLDEEFDLLEDIYNEAEAAGAKVEIVSTDSEEGQLLLKAFGGYAGILRYRVN
ncbi:MAG: peptide chain release factor aRF-1 [Thermoplasmata archaeon]|nr:peptide chain release factor aRF-1 [Thermoplasmata archaeon]